MWLISSPLTDRLVFSLGRGPWRRHGCAHRDYADRTRQQRSSSEYAGPETARYVRFGANVAL